MSIPPEEDGPFIVDYQEPEKDHAYIPCNNNNKKFHNVKTCGKCTIFQRLCSLQKNMHTNTLRRKKTHAKTTDRPTKCRPSGFRLCHSNIYK